MASPKIPKSVNNSPSTVEHWLLLIQVISFAILYAIWILPETIALRYMCLVAGAILSVYPIYQSRALLIQKSAIPIWLILGLFAWATFHLLFLSQNPILQYDEYEGIWKRAAIGAIFAFGMGLSIARSSIGLDAKFQKWPNLYWGIFYGGILAPTLIYLIKSLFTIYGQKLGILVPESLKIYIGPNAVYVAKTAYVAFCLPTLAVALGALMHNIQRRRGFTWINIVYFLTIPAVFLVFYLENIKNGFVYGAILICVFIILLYKDSFKRHWILKMVLAICVLSSVFFLASKHIKQNPSWQTVVMDAKIAWQTDRFPQWKYNGTQGYPNNELGKQVSVTNYERTAWAKEGVQLITQNPLGYGLVERSFGRLAKIQWPDSILHQSHSGWIDLTLGIGLPGLILVLVPLGLLFSGLGKKSFFRKITIWNQMLTWLLGASFLMWCTTEISQKVYLETLIFWLAFGAGLYLGLSLQRTEKSLL